MSDTDPDPRHLEELDPEQFVGESPAGDGRPTEFMSDDQSDPAAGGTDEPDDEPSEASDEPGEDQR